MPTTSLEPLSSEVRELVGADSVPDMRQKAQCIRLGKLPHDFRHAVGAFPLVYCGASRDDRWNHLGMWLVLTKIGHALSGPLAYICAFLAWQVRANRTGIHLTVHAAPEGVVQEWIERMRRCLRSHPSCMGGSRYRSMRERAGGDVEPSRCGFLRLQVCLLGKVFIRPEHNGRGSEAMEH